MTLGHQHASIPRVAGQRNQTGIVGKRLGGDTDIDIGALRLFGDLRGIALVQQQADLRITLGESLEHRRQHVAGLRMRSRDGERPGVLAFEFRADPLEIVEFLQRTPRGRDDHLAARGQRGQPLALPNENRHAQLVLELPDLLADARLRGEQGIGSDRYIEAMIDDGAEITELLEIHCDLVITLR